MINIFLKQEVIYPVLFIIFVILLSLYLNYFQKSSNWLYVIYPQGSKDVFEKTLPHTKYLGSFNPEYNSFTIQLKNSYYEENLVNNGAMLLDPKGVPLCIKKTSQKMLD